MKRLCVIGNSHAGALKSGWRRISRRHPSIEVTFFADRGNGMAHLAIDGDRLIATNDATSKALKHTSAGRDCISFSDYDACLVYALAFEAYRVGEQFYSEASLRQAIGDHVASRLGWHILSLVKKAASIPIFVGHTPLRAAATEDHASKDALQCYQEGIALQNLYAFQPLSVRLLPQPNATIASSFETRKIYSHRSRTLDVGDAYSATLHQPSDNVHMNELFGAVYLEQCIAEIF